MYKIMIKGALFVIGIIFFGYLCFVLFSWEKQGNLYGTISSIQFWSMMILLVILIACLVVDFKKVKEVSFFENWIKGLPKSTPETYFSSLVTVSIGVIGVIAIVMSILYGAYMNASTSMGEYIKLPEQIFTWFLFSLYFIAVTIILFIYPLMKRLGS